jgi:hypothetical protein
MIKHFQSPILFASLLGLLILNNHSSPLSAAALLKLTPDDHRFSDRVASQLENRDTTRSGLDRRGTAPSPAKPFTTQRFSVQAPADWQILDAKPDAFILVTPKSVSPPQDIKIDVGIEPRSLEAVTKRTINSGTDAQLVKTERLTINGHLAIRQYFEGGEFYDRSILTYIDHGKGESAYLSGFYFAVNPKGAETVTAIQNSFQFR